MIHVATDNWKTKNYLNYFSLKTRNDELNLKEMININKIRCKILGTNVGLSWRLLHQRIFFLLERAKSELQLLYQTHFPRTNLTSLKKVLVTSPSSNIIFYFLLVFVLEEKWENSLNDDLRNIKSVRSIIILEIEFALGFHTKI